MYIILKRETIILMATLVRCVGVFLRAYNSQLARIQGLSECTITHDQLSSMHHHTGTHDPSVHYHVVIQMCTFCGKMANWLSTEGVLDFCNGAVSEKPTNFWTSSTC